MSALPRYSPSQIDTFRLCARKWAFTRILPGRSNKYADLGTAVHSALEAWLINGTALDLTSEVGQIAAAGIQHLPRPGLCSIESSFSFETGTARYTGRRDMRFRDTSEGPRAVDVLEVIGDHKTTGDLKWAKTPEDLKTDPQGVIYAMSVFKEEPRAKDCELRWVYYRTKKPYKSHRVSLVVTYEETIERMKGIDATALEMSTFGEKPDPLTVPPTHTACDAYGGCPYQNECGITPRERMRATMAQSALQEKLRLKLLEKNGAGTPTPEPAPATVTATPSATPPATGQTAAERVAALRAKKAAETAAPERAEALEAKAAERAVEVAKEVEAEKPATGPRVERTEAPKLTPVTADKNLADLRDAMAMSALNGMLAARDINYQAATPLAEAAYRIADAMLAARG